MKAVEAVKEKFYCFLGIVHPTYYQSRGWGPWLVHCAPVYQATIKKTNKCSVNGKSEFFGEGELVPGPVQGGSQLA